PHGNIPLFNRGNILNFKVINKKSTLETIIQL
ncbi:unnamed protein product, partial [marine sediment metagenome]